MHVFLDTDIGTDVDDALALGVLIGSPEINLVGISTVYGNTLLRAQLTRRLLTIAGRYSAVPIAAGLTETRSGRPVWWPGHEGALHENLASEPVDPAGGVDALLQAANDYAGELIVLAIGPLTNIAAALDADPDLASKVSSVVVMGGDFQSTNRRAEHNFLSDISAAQRVFASDLSIAIGGLDLTTQVQLDADDVQQIHNGGPFGQALDREIRAWWEFHGHAWNNPHDPILAVWILRPDLFGTRTVDVSIDDDGRSWDTSNPDGRVTVLGHLEATEVAREIVSRIRAASQPVITV